MNRIKIFNDGENVSESSQIEWNAHPAFEGVFMKNILGGENTGSKISAHIVKIEPGCEIGDHVHDGKAELHEVIEGQGYAVINGKRVEYIPGVVSFIPEDIHHNVQAGEKGLLIHAKFIPALS